jgi:MFS family permease
MPRRPVFYGWILLGVSVTIIMLGTGVTFSLAVFLKPLEEEFGWSRGLISGMALLNWIVFGIGSFAWGTLSDRIGARRVVLAGAGLLAAGLVLASQATAPWQLYVSYGVLAAAGGSGFYVPLSATATRWFAARRGLAMGILNSGMGAAILVVPPLSRVLINAFGWRMAFALLALLTAGIALAGARYVYDRPADLGLREYGDGAAPAARAPGGAAMTPGEALRHPALWVLSVVHFGCCLAHAGPLFHMVTHAIDLGVDRLAAASIMGLSGATSMAGRIGAGLLVDRFEAKPTLVGMLALQAAILSTYLVAESPGALFGVAVLFGVAYGGAMPVYALVAREFFGERVVGTTFGGIFLLSCVGMGLGSYGGGVIFDRLGSYWTMHFASTLVGAAAIAVALGLRAPQPAPAPILAGGR